MANEMQAVAAGIIRHALADATFFQLVGGRFVEAEEPILVNLELPAVALRFIPGRVKVGVPGYGVYNFQLAVYSQKSYAECREIYSALWDALGEGRFWLQQDGVNVVLTEKQKPSLDTDPESEERILSCFWDAKAYS